MQFQIEKKINTVYDHYINGGVNQNGELRQVWGQEALNNAIKMWVVSFKGEALRAPNMGGYVSYWLMKPLLPSSIEDVKMSIRDGIEQDFRPKLEIINLIVEPVISERCWKIYLEAFCPSLKIYTVVSEKIKSQT